MKDFTGRLVLVTGAGSGIGRATALRFAAENARVLAVDINGPAAEATAQLARESGTAAHAYTVDVSDGRAIEKLAEDVLADHGVVDVLVNNAGIGLGGNFMDHTVEDWEQVLGVNLWGVIHGCRVFGKQMIERGQGGHIVNVASAAAYTPTSAMPAYCTSKAAVLMLSQCLDGELAGQGIGVTAICPGIIATPITQSARFVGKTEQEQEALRARASRAYGLRHYTPERVAKHIVNAVRNNTAVAPVSPEAHAMRLVHRFAPDFIARRAARFNPLG